MGEGRRPGQADEEAASACRRQRARSAPGRTRGRHAPAAAEAGRKRSGTVSFRPPRKVEQLYSFGPLHFYHFSELSPSRAFPMFAGIFAIGLFFAVLLRRSRNPFMVGIFHGLGNC